jgi:hypothetical protein
MLIVDMLFKFYFVYFRHRGEIGAEASNRLLVGPLTLNLYLIIIFIASYFIKISDVGAIIFALGLVLTGVLVTYLLERIYIVKSRYERISIKYPVLHIIGGIFYFLISCLFFSIGSSLILSK